MSKYAEISEKVEGRNINSKTLLATDYLNHFNEVIMLIEMVPDMPELLEEINAWTPKTYIEHFSASLFANKDLAIEAYEYVPAKYKKAFEYAVGEMDKIVLNAIEHLNEKKDDREDLLSFAKDTFYALRFLIEVTSSVINGIEFTQTQKNVDYILKS